MKKKCLVVGIVVQYRIYICWCVDLNYWPCRGVIHVVCNLPKADFHISLCRRYWWLSNCSIYIYEGFISLHKRSKCMKCNHNMTGGVSVWWPTWSEDEWQVIAILAVLFDITQMAALNSAKCYHGGRKINFIPPISDMLAQRLYHCVQFTNRHHQSLILNF